MFWHVGFTQPSPIEGILDKDSYTLQELLEEDDLIQEVKSQNERLVVFLRTPETLMQLISYIVVPPAADTEYGSDTKHLKYPFAACEVFCCEVDSIMGAVVQEDEPLNKLFSLLDEPPPLNCVMAGYFTRVVTSLLIKRSQELLAYLQHHPQILSRAVAHLSSASIAELLVRLSGADESLSTYVDPAHLAFLAETPLTDQLLTQLSTGNFSAGAEASASSQEQGAESSTEPAEASTTVVQEARQQAAIVLASIAHNHECPLAVSFTDADYLERLYTVALAPDVSMQALDVCLALLDQRLPPSESSPNGPEDSPRLHVELDAQIKEAAVLGLLGHLPRVMELLQSPGPLAMEGKHLTPFGALTPPLGLTRLKTVQLVTALLCTDVPAADDAVIESGVLGQCLALFRAYPFNNLLHTQVSHLIMHALGSTNQSLTAHLLGPCNLLPWLFTAPALVDLDGAPTLELAGKRTSTSDVPQRRMETAWMGHITRMGNKLAEAAGNSPDIAAALGSSKQWPEWSEAVLKPRNDRENVMQWGCGRPSHTERMSSMDREPEAGLLQDLGEDPPNGNSLIHGNAGPMGRGMGAHRYGAFDPEDDDDDDDIRASQGANAVTLDAAAAFRNLNLGRSPMGGAMGSDSSSSDDSDGSPTSPGPLMHHLDDDTVMVSTHDADGDESFATANSNSAGLVNFADFGDFSPPSTAHQAAKAGSSGDAQGGFNAWGAEGQEATSTSGNHLQDDDAGWAVFDDSSKPFGESSAFAQPTATAQESSPVQIPSSGRPIWKGHQPEAPPSSGTGDSRPSSHHSSSPSSPPSPPQSPPQNPPAAPQTSESRSPYAYWPGNAEDFVEMMPDDFEDGAAKHPEAQGGANEGSQGPAGEGSPEGHRNNDLQSAMHEGAPS
ncbi:hypothetical protein WJX73_005157 [Symbiochloris irregularis]|uniref:Uncharacterized protein n=1 Tax=Symbiochloris irregularis TaxID=706552 RepID=A0AAW1PM74_9CHLO